MGFLTPAVGDEKEALTTFLVQQCQQLRTTALALTDAQARLTPTAGALSILGLLAHLAQGIELWLRTVELAPDPRTPDQIDALTVKIGLPVQRFTGGEVPDLTLDEVLAIYDAVVASVPDRVAAYGLEDRVPVPDAPWFPDDVESWNVRWVILHLIAEVARHVGQADIIRENIDGATAYQLNAQADGQDWPA